MDIRTVVSKVTCTLDGTPTHSNGYVELEGIVVRLVHADTSQVLDTTVGRLTRTHRSPMGTWDGVEEVKLIDLSAREKTAFALASRAVMWSNTEPL